MKIAYILITNGLEYDDRIRKEMFSMREIADVEFKVFAFHGDNHAEEGVLSYGVPYEIVSLKHRGGKKGLIDQLRKEYDFYSQIKPKVKDYDLLWCCDHQPFFFPLFSNKPIIWDLHELPGSLMGNSLKNILFHRMERRCKYLIHANQERLDYLIKKKVIKIPEKNLVIRNYPDKSWIAESKHPSDSFLRFKEWLGNDEYVYIQGINNPGRYPWETLSALVEVNRIKAVVIGNVSSEIKDRICSTYSNADSLVYFTGQVVQSETSAFIANCKFSMIFYRADKPNNRYCEPNRMFQNMAFGKPVIVGCNEPMANVVREYGNGVVLKSDGRDVTENVAAICQMIDNYSNFEKKAQESKGIFSWEKQNDIFRKLLSL